jgi:DHA1 family bicyclomycin/chloramphenicol resistance-like MFS transporter
VASFAPSVPAVAASIFVFVASLGLFAANTTAAALEGQGPRAGLASALLGTAQFTTSSLASAAVGVVASVEVAGGAAGTGRPMAFVMVACATMALGLVLLGRRLTAR